MYISMRNRPFCSTFWNVSRGKEAAASIRKIVYSGHCCEYFVDTKIRTHIKGLSLVKAEASIWAFSVAHEEPPDDFGAEGAAVQCGRRTQTSGLYYIVIETPIQICDAQDIAQRDWDKILQRRTTEVLR